MLCECGFKFETEGFRNCNAFVTADGKGGIICPKCGNTYLDGEFTGKVNSMVFRDITKGKVVNNETS